ncbi:hypothetical protein TI05_07225 [Achromatium sp. WMS3]|nr:hypothetical protein TI05_07225 [Achromatium sp. WMS3]
MYKIITLSLILMSTPAFAVWPIALSWSSIQTGAIYLAQQVGIEIAAEYLQSMLTPSKVEKLQQQVTDLNTQLQQATAANKASPAELAQTRNLLEKTEKLLAAMSKQLRTAHQQNQSLEAARIHLQGDVKLVQNELADLRKQLHAANVDLRQPFAEQPSAALTVNVNYSYRRQGETTPHQLTNGSVLYSGDRYKITFTSNQKVWLYLYQTDSSGKIFQLFPATKMFGRTLNQLNPVPANETRTVPLDNGWFILDDQQGTEFLYLIAAPQQDKVLEASYLAYQQAQAEGNSQLVQTAKQQLKANLMVSRGPAGITLDDPTVTAEQTVTTEDGSVFAMNAGYLAGLCSRPGGCINVLQFEHK